MPLSNCSQCRYVNRHPNHRSDILCAVNPTYPQLWQRLKDLNSSTLNSLPVDICTDFEIDPSLEEKTITLSLSPHQWEQISTYSSSCSKTIVDFLNSVRLELSLSLTIKNWQAIANSTFNPHVLDRLAEYGIEPDKPRWIEVDSSCIAAIAYDRSRSVLLIRFNVGSIYQYDNFPYDVFDEFRYARSQGTFFNAYIKNHYPYRQL